MSTPNNEPNHLSHSCARASSSKVLMDSDKGEDSHSFWGSISYLDIPIATHFSQINFDDWTLWLSKTPVDCSEVEYPSDSVNTPDDGFVLDNESRENTYLFPKLEGIHDYCTIKFGESGFYEYGSCYFQGNWLKKKMTQGKKKWSLRNFPQEVLDDISYWENMPKHEGYLSSELRKGNPPKIILKALLKVVDDGTSKSSD